MLRGAVLGLALILAAALQLVGAPAASADGGLMGGLTDILNPNPTMPSEADDPSLIGDILDTVDEVTEPVTGDLLDPVKDTLDSVTSDLDEPPTGTLEEALAGISGPLAETLISAMPAEAGAADLVAPSPAVAPAAESPLAPAGSLVEAVLEPVALVIPDSVAVVTEPLAAVVADVAPLRVNEPISSSPSLQLLTSTFETLQPVIAGLQPVLEPALGLTTAVVRPILILVEPISLPVLRLFDRLLQPVTGLLQHITNPVVDVLPPAPETEEPPPPRAASTAGNTSPDQDYTPVQMPALARTAVLTATASLQALHTTLTEVSKPAGVFAIPLRIFEGVMLTAGNPSDSVSTNAGAPAPMPGAIGPGEDDSSSKFQAPHAALPQLMVLMMASYFLLMLISRTRSESWLKCPVRPPT